NAPRPTSISRFQGGSQWELMAVTADCVETTPFRSRISRQTTEACKGGIAQRRRVREATVQPAAPLSSLAPERVPSVVAEKSWRISGTEATIPFFPPIALDRLQEGQGEQRHRDVVVSAPVPGGLVVVEPNIAL